MHIVVNHLTRMQHGYMCVAGIELETNLHVRPMLDRPMKVDLLSVHGGPFDIGRIVDLGNTRFMGKMPEVEDRWFDASAARHAGDMPTRDFWQLLQKVAKEKLGAVFGPDLKRRGSNCAVAERAGLRSLGCYWAHGGRLFLDEKRERWRIRFAWQVDDYPFNVPVTDIRLYSGDHVTPSVPRVRRLEEQIAAQPRVLVSVGLSRPYHKMAGDSPRHWLQINNFHFPDNPCWKLADLEHHGI